MGLLTAIIWIETRGGEINRVDSIGERYKNKLAAKHSNNVTTQAKIEYKTWKLEEQNAAGLPRNEEACGGGVNCPYIWIQAKPGEDDGKDINKCRDK